MRGRFQRLTVAQRTELARKGGHASPNQWTSEQARVAGAKGGTRHTGNQHTRQRPAKLARARQVLSERFWGV
jgi:hypothetical protein